MAGPRPGGPKPTVLTLSLSLLCGPALADEVAHHFSDVPVSQLFLLDTSMRSLPTAVIESRDGQAAVVREGELIGKERVRILKVMRRCLALDGRRPQLLCVEQANAPRS